MKEERPVIMDFRKAATEIADTLVAASGGPLTTRDDGIKFVEAYLREVYRRGRENISWTAG